MSMSGTRLTGNLHTHFLSQLQSTFPMPAGLQPGEQTAFNTAQNNLAQALANAAGPDVVTEVQQATVNTNVSVVSVSGVTSGSSSSGPGTGTGVGTVS